MYKYMHTIAFHSVVPRPPFNSASLKDAGYLEKGATFHLLQCIPGGKL